MNEPTILDYIKSIFKSFDSFTNFVHALFEKKDTTQMEEFRSTPQMELASPQPAGEAVVPAIPQRGRFFQKIPWLVLGMLFFALIGQLQFEPPQTLYSIGIFCYLIALGLGVVAFFKR